MTHKCLHPGCTNLAPYGYRWPGPRASVPAGKTGYIWSCLEHRSEAETRRDAAVAETTAKRKTDDG